ncbi:GATA zinc finger domain-containing protein 1 [Armadillidium nasatum]|uniref:GATA zinc finger domain-containing protein 1 n=1 Tax=Armadillidium nasatum TaxID=96803 RepID=A0A5N5SJH5_9CRUS|nr:GATA zinc finger domain-containing protein 1 [Armadillidium nasatum]
MVLGVQPECSHCKTKDSSLWQKGPEKEVLCQCCQKLKNQKLNGNGKETSDKSSSSSENERKESSQETINSKKSSKEEENEKDKEGGSTKQADKKDCKRRTRKGKYGGKGNIPKGKGRRYIFKKSATKAPAAVSTPVTCEYVFHQGTYYQVGDIVSVIDIEGGTFYAQIRGLLQDQYCEKSAVITWLLPTKSSPPPEEKFDPSTYIIGPEEDIPRKLEYMRFVCHAPSDYYKDRTSPYATTSFRPHSCFVWSKLGPVIQPIDSDD